MKFKNTLFIGILLILSSVFVVGCTKYVPEESNYVFGEKEMNLMQSLEKESMINFSEIEPDALIWNYSQFEKIESIGLQGYMFSVRGTKVKDEIVNKFFEEKGFIFDVFNAADGIYVGQVGYQSDSMVCTVVSGVSNPGSTDSSIKNLSDITVRCSEYKG